MNMQAKLEEDAREIKTRTAMFSFADRGTGFPLSLTVLVGNEALASLACPVAADVRLKLGRELLGILISRVSNIGFAPNNDIPWKH